MLRKDWRELGVGTGGYQKVLEEILAGVGCVGENWSDYRYVINTETGLSFGCGDQEKERNQG